jgi:2-dehydropantoate 2-reductase
MKIAVVGTGGVGGYFGGLLAISGQDVTFIARGAHLDAIREHGLQVSSLHGDFLVTPANATEDMTRIGAADLVLVCVKDFHLERLIPEMGSMIGKATTILPLLNGVSAADRLSQAFGQDRALGGNCHVVAFIAEPGVIQQISTFRRIAFGEWDGQMTPRTQELHRVFQATGVEVELSLDIRKTMWKKYLFIAAYSGVASVVRLPAAGIHACQETMEILRQAMVEIEEVARAAGVALDEDDVEYAMDFARGLAPEATASMQRDVEAGRPSELEALTGYLVRKGRETGTPTPVNSFLYAALKPHELNAQL